MYGVFQTLVLLAVKLLLRGGERSLDINSELKLLDSTGTTTALELSKIIVVKLVNCVSFEEYKNVDLNFLKEFY